MMIRSKFLPFEIRLLGIFFCLRFYIGCDVCADWLHGFCVNITSADAEKFEVYVCPRCSTEKKQEFLNKPIAGETRKKLLHLLDQLLVKEY
jgi:protein-arginine kinase activator protein McsA